jgi:hypothetical protein
VSPCQLRADAALNSDRCGTLRVGETIAVLEERQLDGGELVRLRCARGWASKRSPSDRSLLKRTCEVDKIPVAFHGEQCTLAVTETGLLLWVTASARHGSGNDDSGPSQQWRYRKLKGWGVEENRLVVMEVQSETKLEFQLETVHDAEEASAVMSAYAMAKLRQKMARQQSRGTTSGNIEHQLDDLVSQFEQTGYDEDARNSEPQVRDSMKPMGESDGQCCPLPAASSLAEVDGRALHRFLSLIALVYTLAMLGYLSSRLLMG